MEPKTESETDRYAINMPATFFKRSHWRRRYVHVQQRSLFFIFFSSIRPAPVVHEKRMIAMIFPPNELVAGDWSLSLFLMIVLSINQKRMVKKTFKLNLLEAVCALLRLRRRVFERSLPLKLRLKPETIHSTNEFELLTP